MFVLEMSPRLLGSLGWDLSIGCSARICLVAASSSASHSAETVDVSMKVS